MREGGATAETKGQMTRVRRSKEAARATYDRLSGWYDVLAGSSERRYVDAGLRTLDVQAGEQVLEIGFGTGHALVSLARSTGDPGRAYGVDISTGMGRIALDRVREGGVGSTISLICGDGARLPFRDSLVDAIFMSFTLELFDTPEIPRVLQECWRVLRRGGRMCVVSLSKRGEGNLALRLYEWIHRRYPRYVDCRPIFVRGLLQEAGFRILDVAQYSMWCLPVDIVLADTG